MNTFEIIVGNALDVLRGMEPETIDCCVTSPPYYGLRDYGVDGQLGTEGRVETYIENMVSVFHEVRRLLRNDGTMWVNIGDSYAGSGKGRYADGHHSGGGKQSTNTGSMSGRLLKTSAQGCKPKDLIGIPWLLAFALRADGWYLRQDIIWQKPNAMPENVQDRCTKSHEYIFLLSKSRRYYFDHEEMQEPAIKTSEQAHIHPGRYGGKKYTGTPEQFFRTKSGNIYNYTGRRNKRDVWSVSTQGYKGAHFATFPEKLIEPCILAGCREGGTVLDPFIGSGTTAVCALKHGRNCIGIEINKTYAAIANKRIRKEMDYEQIRIDGRTAL